ncbi:MAG: tetratricopeptide repeat protein [Candidatus Eisenbacteria bacterium]|nr:tetratricopeptide repeat protein [Candidatus Latescibacterota bacterium]MBD3302354.1 tetratricopeptide repeat protein [Candidatus Eisenbacteria bacterium]
MSRPAFLRVFFTSCILVAAGAASAQQMPSPNASREELLAYWADVMKAATARIQVQDESGSPLSETYGVVLGDPPRLVTRLRPLRGAARLTATFPGGGSVAAESLHTYDPANDIAVLRTTGTLPPPPQPDDKIRWRYREVCYVIPAPGMDPAWPRETLSSPLELEGLEVAPLSGDHPGGLPVMYPSGQWIGLTGRIEDGSDHFVYLTPMGAILPTLFDESDPTPLAVGAEEVSAFLPDDTAEGLLVRAVIRAFEDDASAEVLFNEALDADPSIPQLHFEYGRSLFRQQRHQEAEIAFREAIHLRPDWPDAYQMAGATANQQGDYTKALDYYEKGLEVDPNSIVILLNQWGAYFNLGRIQPAIASLEKILSLDPGHDLAAYNLGMTYLQSGRIAEAEAQHRRLQSLESRYAPRLREKIDNR